jgi:iron complex transport system substrate-binding protein
MTRGRSTLMHLIPLLALVRVLVLLPAACDRRHTAATAPAPTRPAALHPTIASLVPAATDLLAGMGAGDHLVAISNYDTARPETAGLPKVGDYQSIDWERLTTLRPDVLITFQAPDRLPAGLREKADALHIRLVNIRTETLADLYAEITHLGDVANEPAKAAAARTSLQSQFDAVRASVANLPKVRTLIVRDETASGAVGPGTFLNDVLDIAGGTNVLITPGWPNLDREQLLSLHPDAILQLLAGAPPQVEAEARAVWPTLPTIPAVANHHVTVINQWYALQPGFHLPDLARQFAAALHPEAVSPTTPNAATEQAKKND